MLSYVLFVNKLGIICVSLCIIVAYTAQSVVGQKTNHRKDEWGEAITQKQLTRRKSTLKKFYKEPQKKMFPLEIFIDIFTKDFP